jgi:hypothetical protein
LPVPICDPASQRLAGGVNEPGKIDFRADHRAFASFRRCVARYGGEHLLQILSVSLFEKMPIQQAFSDPALQSEDFQTDNQLNLFEF